MSNIFQDVLMHARKGKKEKQRGYIKPAVPPKKRLRPIRSERYDLTRGQISMHQAWDKLMGVNF